MVSADNKPYLSIRSLGPGCIQCKKWRKRCDQTFPKCGACQKRRIKCSYEDIETASYPLAPETTASNAREKITILFETGQNKPRAKGSRITTSSTSSQSKSWQAKEDWPSSILYSTPKDVFALGAISAMSSKHSSDLELINHYLSVTSVSLAWEPTRQRLWRHSIVSQAMENGFLMHNLLALSAAHITHLRSENARCYMDLAMYHLNQASIGFRKAIRAVHPENCAVVFASSGLTLLSQLGLFRSRLAIFDKAVNPIEELLQIFLLIRKIVPMWMNSIQHLRNEHNGRTLIMRYPPIEINLPQEIHTALQKLKELIDVEPLPFDERNIYNQAVSSLQWNTLTILARPRDFGQVARWANMIKQEYIDLLVERNPIALFILANYCILLHHAGTRWCLQGWAMHVLNAVKDSIGEEWLPRLQWVEEAMSISPLLELTDDITFHTATPIEFYLPEPREEDQNCQSLGGNPDIGAYTYLTMLHNAPYRTTLNEFLQPEEEFDMEPPPRDVLPERYCTFT